MMGWLLEQITNIKDQWDLPHNIKFFLKILQSQTTTPIFRTWILANPTGVWWYIHFELSSSIMDLKTSTLTEMLSACRELEEVAAGLHENLQDAKRRQLHICTKKEAEDARKQRAKVAKEFPPAQRARCTAQSRLQVTLDALNETLMSNTQQERLGVISFCFFC